MKKAYLNPPLTSPRRGIKRVVLITVVIILFQTPSFAQGWQTISNFGNNPGNLNAYQYVPANMPANAPLVVVMHGCSQNATNFSNETGWNTLAEFHKFYVVHAEQKSANNATTCFNYWETGDHSRGQGEAASIKQMVDYMKSHYSVDNSRVFATGLSAGGAMTAVMLSAYPDVFAAGAEMAGLPYKVATSSLEVITAATGLTSKSPQQWGDLVRAQYPSFTGSYPRLVIIHGTSDIVINKNNAEEMMKQFTNLHNTDQTADYTDNAFKGNSVVQLKQYEDASGQVVIERYTIDNMGHGIAVDPGSCFEQGGGTGSNALDVNFYSSYYAAKFFDILQPPFAINGLDSIIENAQGVNYSVANNAGTTYDWEVSGGTIANGQGTNSIVVDWVDSSGVVSLTETTSGGCTLGPVELTVAIEIEDTIDEPIDTNTAIGVAVSVQEGVLITELNGHIQYTVKSTFNSSVQINLYTISGQMVFEAVTTSNQPHTLGNLSHGIYFLKCTAGENRYIKKIVIH